MSLSPATSCSSMLEPKVDRVITVDGRTSARDRGSMTCELMDRMSHHAEGRAALEVRVDLGFPVPKVGPHGECEDETQPKVSRGTTTERPKDHGNSATAL